MPQPNSITFGGRQPLIGPIFWMLSLQYYIAQYLVSRSFRPGFSWLQNTISDLGNTACAQYGSRPVCSP